MSPSRFLYAPEAFAARDPVAIVRRYPFALLVSPGPTALLATHLPLFFETDTSEAYLIGHIARNNPHAAALGSGQSALAVFSGPHAYIQSSWYREKLTVPTWNYLSAHVRGTLEPIDDPQTVLDILARTAALLEGRNDPPWTLQDAPPGRVDFLLPMIRGFRIKVERIEGVTKLNQTHPVGDQRRVAHRLLERNAPGDTEIAELMMERLIDQ